MASELGAAYISVTTETSKVAGELKKAFSGAESSGADAGKSAGRGFGLGFAGIATAAVGALGVGTFLKGAIEGAGSLQQSAGAISSVFKGSAADMLAWSQTADTAVGLTQNEFNELGTLIGSQLKNGGTAMDELAPKTNSLIGVGADLASMFGGTTADAVGALSSALKGERDPIEKYGVSLSQAKIDAEAAALGFDKVGGSLSAEANQAATLSLIMKQTADATGNFAKESETLSGQQQRMSAGFKDIQTNIGGLFLPALTSVFGFINTNILPSLDKFTASLGDEGLAGAFAPLMAVAGPIFSTLAAQFGPLIPQVLQLVSSFSPLGLLFQVLTPILPMLSAAFTQITGSIAGVLAIVIPLVSQLVSALLPIIVDLVSTVLPPLAAMFGELIAAVAPFVVQLASELIPIVNALLPVVTTVFTVISAVIKSAMQIIQGIIRVVTGAISGDWSKVWGGLGDIVSGALNTVGTVLGGLKDIVVSALGNIGGWLVDSGRALIQGFIDGIGGMVGAIGNAVGDVLGSVADFFPHSPAKKGPFSGRGYTTYSGAALAGDFADSIRGQRSYVAAAAAAVTGAAVLSGSMVPAAYTPAGARGANGATPGGTVNNFYELSNPRATAWQVAAIQERG